MGGGRGRPTWGRLWEGGGLLLQLLGVRKAPPTPKRRRKGLDSGAYIFLIKEKSETLEREQIRVSGRKMDGGGWREGRGSGLSPFCPRLSVGLSVCDRQPLSLTLWPQAPSGSRTVSLKWSSDPQTLAPRGGSRWGPDLGPVLADPSVAASVRVTWGPCVPVRDSQMSAGPGRGLSLQLPPSHR